VTIISRPSARRPDGRPAERREFSMPVVHELPIRPGDEAAATRARLARAVAAARAAAAELPRTR
jgi:hypothetical protein